MTLELTHALGELAIALGGHFSASFIYEGIKDLVSSKHFTKEELTQELSKKFSSKVSLENAKLLSEKAIDIMIENGELKNNGTYMFSDEAIIQQTGGDGTISSKNSTFKTTNTEISIQGTGAEMTQTGNAIIKQDKDGITIKVSGSGSFTTIVKG